MAGGPSIASDIEPGTNLLGRGLLYLIWAPVVLAVVSARRQLLNLEVIDLVELLILVLGSAAGAAIVLRWGPRRGVRRGPYWTVVGLTVVTLSAVIVTWTLSITDHSDSLAVAGLIVAIANAIGGSAITVMGTRPQSSPPFSGR